MAASAVEDSCQMPVIRGEKLSDLRPVERGYFIGLDRKGDAHYLPALSIIDRRLLRNLLSLSALRRV
jgi:hypothetical protein